MSSPDYMTNFDDVRPPVAAAGPCSQSCPSPPLSLQQGIRVDAREALGTYPAYFCGVRPLIL